MDNQKNIKYLSLPVLSKEKISKTKKIIKIVI